MPFFAGYHQTMGAGLRGLILPSAPGVCAWATPFCPFLAKTGGSRWDRVAKYIFFFQFDHTNDLYGFQYWRPFFKYKDLSMQPHLPGDLSLLVLIVQRAQHAAPPAGEVSLPVTKSSACSPESFSPGTTELNFQPHQSANT